MQTKHHQTMHIDNVILRVNDLAKMKAYYTNSIGLTLLTETTEQVFLGVEDSQQPLLILDGKAGHKLITGSKNGLYHNAFLLPSRKDLGDVLYRLLVDQVPLIGSADHSYSEAIYLQDPEDNGIEIYVDRDDEKWMVNENGQIIGVTEPMDAESVLAERSAERVDKLPAGTIIGHMHLSSANVKAMSEFFVNVLNLKMQMFIDGNVYFTSYDNYHHHFAANGWGNHRMAPYAADQTGLASYTLRFNDISTFDTVKANIEKFDLLVKDSGDVVEATDATGVTFKIALNNPV